MTYPFKMGHYSLVVSEQFHSLQGEGPTMGVPAYFLRLRSCNLLCGGIGTDKDKALHDGATWRCDTVEVWLKGDRMAFEDIVSNFGPEFIRNIKYPSGIPVAVRSPQFDCGMHHLVLTGGEPLLQSEMLGHFLAYVNGTERPISYVEVETNGTIIPHSMLSPKVSQWNISPKLKNSGMSIEKRVVPEALQWFVEAPNSYFKFVVGSYADIMEAIKTYVIPYNITPSQVWFMPAADNDVSLQQVSKEIAAFCIDGGYRFSSRLHVAIWNQKTGV